MELRAYQTEAITRVESSWQDFQKVLLSCPTGSGKTVIFSHLAHRNAQLGKRTLILAHRDELIRQAADKLQRATDLFCGIEKAGETSRPEDLVVVGSVQSMMRDNRLARFTKDAFDYIICDESHHALSDSWQKVLSYFGSAKVLGVTATPERGDKRNLGQYFECLAYEYTLRTAVEEGYLCPITAQTIPIDIDLTKVRTKGGDFDENELDTAIAPYLSEIAKLIAEKARDRKTLIFLPLISTSKRMTELMADNGVLVTHIDGTSLNRAPILRDFLASTVRPVALCNSMLLTEGYDNPSIDCIVVLHPTKSRVLYSQMVGRGMRICDKKKNLLILDFLWHSERHSLCRPAHLIAETEDIAERIIAKQNANGGGDLFDLEEQAKSEVGHEREAALARYIDANKKRKARTIDPLWFAATTHDMDLAEYEPTFGWEKEQATALQVKMLTESGFDAEGITKGYASKIISGIVARRNGGLATPKQLRILAKQGYGHIENMTFEKANQVIDQIAKRQGWGRR